MKKLLAVALATMFMLASVPAFACGGDHDKTAKKDDGETLMTSVDDGDKADTATKKKTKKAKKDDEKKDDEKETKTDDSGEV